MKLMLFGERWQTVKHFEMRAKSHTERHKKLRILLKINFTEVIWFATASMLLLYICKAFTPPDC